MLVDNVPCLLGDLSHMNFGMLADAYLVHPTAAMHPVYLYAQA